ncbi:MAG: hypothetical protein RIA64_14675 [Rhodospirillales bacterium]
MQLGNRWIAGLLAGGMALAVVQPANARETEQKFGDWTYKFIADNFDGSRQHIAHVMGRGEDGKRATGALLIKCDDEKMAPYATYLTVRAYFGVSGKSLVRYRVDQSPLVEELWKKDERSVINFDKPKVGAMVHQLIEGSTFTIEAIDLRGTAHRTIFSLKGSNAALTRVLENCGDK